MVSGTSSRSRHTSYTYARGCRVSAAVNLQREQIRRDLAPPERDELTAAMQRCTRD